MRDPKKRPSDLIREVLEAPPEQREELAARLLSEYENSDTERVEMWLEEALALEPVDRKG